MCVNISRDKIEFDNEVIKRVDNFLQEYDYQFINKPILIGGTLKELYKIRKAGYDIDFVIAEEDYRNLVENSNLEFLDQFGEKGLKDQIAEREIEFWLSITKFNYQDWISCVYEFDSFFALTLSAQLLMSMFGSIVLSNEKRSKQLKDAQNISKLMTNIIYGN